MADPARQRLWVIECKAITPGRMPHEVATEARKLFDERGGKLSAVEKHRRREADVRGRPSRALARLGHPPDEGWTVEALIVVDQELFTPYLRRSPVRVVPLDHLRSLIASPGTPMGSMDTHGGSGVDRPLVAPSSPVL